MPPVLSRPFSSLCQYTSFARAIVAGLGRPGQPRDGETVAAIRGDRLASSCSRHQFALPFAFARTWCRLSASQRCPPAASARDSGSRTGSGSDWSSWIALQHRPGDGEPVIGRGAAPDLIEDDERLRGVACARIAAVSIISTMNVERPRARLSEAPTRLNRRSTRPQRRLRSPGTKLPACAKHGDQRVLAQKGGFPAHIRPGDQPQTRRLRTGMQSLATKRSPDAATAASTTGWRPPSTSKQA